MNNAQRGIVWTGLGFVVLFVAGGLLLGELFGAFADPDHYFIAYFADPDHQIRDLIGGHLIAASAFALLLFCTLLTRYLRSMGTTETGLQIAQVSGMVAVTLLLVGVSAVLCVSMAKAFGRISGDDPLTSPAVALAPQLGYVLVFFPTMWAAALTIGGFAWAGWNRHLWGRGVRWLSVAAALLLPLSWISFMPVLLLPIWVLAVSAWAWRSTPTGGHGPDVADVLPQL